MNGPSVPLDRGIGIVGCGLIGRKRALAYLDAPLLLLHDLDRSRAEALAADLRERGGRAETADLDGMLSDPRIALVVAAVTNEALAATAIRAAGKGKHVLLEKPGARSAAELAGVESAVRRAGVLARVGFNHRCHPALREARRIVDEGRVGELMFLRARYGHGGRLGYEKEWRFRRALSGGGELIDQGVHLIDLARWFLGDFPTVEGFAGNFFWGGEVEDNGFLTLRTADGRAAFLHASCTEWKNLFSLEIYGRTGKIEVNGLGGSYGVESLTLYAMRPEMGPPDTTRSEFPEPDRSWRREMETFAEDIRLGRAPEPGLADARGVLEIVESIYRKSGYPVFGEDT